MTATAFLRQLRRESRGSRARLLFFVLCLAAGVAAVVAVAGVSGGLDRGIRREARQLLAADLAISGRRPATGEILSAIDAIDGSRRTEVKELLTLVVTAQDSGTSQLVELKSIGEGYPFYGNLETVPQHPLRELLGIDGALAAPELLSRLGLAVGDRLRIGHADFELRGTLIREPDRMASAFSMGPRVMVSAAGLERADLERFGSRVLYRTLVCLPEALSEQVDDIATSLGETLTDDGRYRIETYREAQPALRRGLDRMDRYLGLAALLSLIVGGIGVAQTVRAWLASRMDTIAVLRCLGYRSREIAAVYVGQTALLALAGSLVGAAGGIAIQLLATQLLQGIVPVELLDPWQPLAILRGLALGLGITLLFSWPPLAAARRVPPARVLRHDVEPLPPSRRATVGTACLLLLGLLATASLQARSFALGAAFTGGLLAATALLGAGAMGLTRLARRPRQTAAPWLRHGLAALGRPGASTLSGIVALGLGVLLLFAMHLVERRLASQLEQDLPKEAPSAFLVDIQPDQWSGVESLLRQAGAERINSVPVVMARLTSLDGRPVAEAADEAEDGDARWALRREQRLTYLEQLPEDNVVVAGELWSRPGIDEISIEEDFARSLGLSLGSKVIFDIQGVPVELEVSSLRQVDWESFGINFFLVAEPGALEDAPQFRVAAAQLPPGHEQGLQDQLAAAYPNVTLLKIRDVLMRVGEILARLSLGARLLGLLTILAGLAILAGAVSAASARRGAEVALLKTLGMPRAQVMATFATEYALIGAVSGILGTVGGSVLAFAVVTQGMEIEWHLPVAHLALAFLLTVLLAVSAGLAASLGALRKRPVEVLRTAE